MLAVCIIDTQLLEAVDGGTNSCGFATSLQAIALLELDSLFEGSIEMTETLHEWFQFLKVFSVD